MPTSSTPTPGAGWQRAGALVNFFAVPQTGIVRPSCVYAETPPGGNTATGRPLQTVTPLAEKLSALLTEEYLEERGKRGNRKKFQRALNKVADVEPEEQDRVS